LDDVGVYMLDDDEVYAIAREVLSGRSGIRSLATIAAVGERYRAMMTVRDWHRSRAARTAPAPSLLDALLAACFAPAKPAVAVRVVERAELEPEPETPPAEPVAVRAEPEPEPEAPPAEPEPPTETTADNRLAYHEGWPVPRTVVDAWAISQSAAKMMVDRYEIDRAKLEDETDPGPARNQEWRRRVWSGEAIDLVSSEVYEVLYIRRQDLAAGIRTKVPAELRAMVSARRDKIREAWLAGKNKKQPGRGKDGEKRPNRVVEKRLQENEFLDLAGKEKDEGGYGLDVYAQLTWVHMWRGEREGRTETTERTLADRLGRVHRNTLRARIDLLLELGFLDLVSKGDRGKSSSVYMISHRPTWPKPKKPKQ